MSSFGGTKSDGTSPVKGFVPLGLRKSNI